MIITGASRGIGRAVAEQFVREGAVVGMIDNAKIGTERLFDFLAEILKKDYGVREFLRVVRGSACKRFATVLSPDYNAAHHDHLHVEVGSGKFCA